MSEKEEVIAVVSDCGEQELSEEVSLVEAEAKSIAVRNEEEYKEAAEFGRMLKRKSAEVVEFFAPMKKSAYDAHKQICDREKAMLKPISEAEKILKKTMGEYQMEQERKRRETEEKLRMLAKQEEDRLLAEAIKMEKLGENEMAEGSLENAMYVEGSAKYYEIKDSMAKADGVSSSIDYEIVSIDEKLVPVNVGTTIIRPVDEKAVLKYIRENKGKVEIAGVKFKEVVKMSFRK